MHNIEENDRQEGTEIAWHELTHLRPDFSLDNNWLRDWDVEPRRVFVETGRDLDDRIEIPFRQLVCTDDDSILVGYPYNPETYKPLLNSEFLKLAEDCVAGTGHKLVSGGSVRNRGRTFLSFKIEGLESFKAGGRSFDSFLNFGNGHDKSSVIWANTSNTCSVCDNTFSANLYSAMRAGAESLDGNKMSARLRHTINFDAKLPDIVDLVEKAVGVQAEFAVAFESLTSKPCSPAVARNVYAGFIAAPDVKTLQPWPQPGRSACGPVRAWSRQPRREPRRRVQWCHRLLFQSGWQRRAKPFRVQRVREWRTAQTRYVEDCE